MAQNKSTLLAHLTLWQEAARNAQKEQMGRVVFKPKEMERVCGQLRAYIEEDASSVCATLAEIYDKVGKALGNFAQRLKDHWKHSPSLFNTIDKELAQSIAELKCIEARPAVEEGQFRITIEDGNDGSVEVLETDIFDLFYVKDEDEDELYMKECMAVRDKVDGCVFYFALRELCEDKNKDSNGMLESMYEKYKAHCSLEEVAEGGV